jgi:hypothetical protein
MGKLCGLREKRAEVEERSVMGELRRPGSPFLLHLPPDRRSFVRRRAGHAGRAPVPHAGRARHAARSKGGGRQQRLWMGGEAGDGRGCCGAHVGAVGAVTPPPHEDADEKERHASLQIRSGK